MTEKEVKEQIRKRIENICGCPLENFALSLESCMRLSGESSAVTITDWDAQHLHMIIIELLR